MSTPIMPESLKIISQKLLEAVNVPRDHARMIADVLVAADLRGVGSHGVMRLPAYIHKVQAGLLSPATDLTWVRQFGATGLLDANGGFGQVAAIEGMKEAVRLAEEHGVGVIGVRNASHFGIAAYYALLAAEQGMIGVVVSNAAPSMAPFGGVEPMLGTNPLCIAMLTSGEIPLVLDMAASVAARGKIRMAEKVGKPIPKGWALDNMGNPTTDPSAALSGTLCPIGGPKGYGIALVNDVLAGLLTGSPSGQEVRSIHDLEAASPVGFYLQAIKIDAFSDLESFSLRLDTLLNALRMSKRSEGIERIYTPGEPEWEEEQIRRTAGILMDDAVLQQLRTLADELAVEVEI